jgi:hypothetical protein
MLKMLVEPIERPSVPALRSLQSAIDPDILKCVCSIQRINVDVVDMPTHIEVISALQSAVLPSNHQAEDFKVKLPNKFYPVISPDEDDEEYNEFDDGMAPFYNVDIKAPSIELLLRLNSMLSNSFYNIVRIDVAYEMFAEEEAVLCNIVEFFREDSRKKKPKISMERRENSVIITRKLKRKQISKHGLTLFTDLVQYDSDECIINDLRLSAYI